MGVAQVSKKHNLSKDKSAAGHYRNAGVNIEAGNQLVSRLSTLVDATRRDGVMSGLGGFGGLFQLSATTYQDPVLVAATDGVGTKLMLAQQHGKHGSIGIDLVAMCVNDLIVQGAEPLFFLDYFACGTLEVDQAEAVIAGIAEGCQEAGCSLIGGETAEMPGMYPAGKYDLAGFAVGAVEREKLLPSPDMKEDDLVIGLASSGAHSNGYSLVRKLVEQSNAVLDQPAPYDDTQSLGDSLLTPTRIYVASCLKAINTGRIRALAHITGGGLTENIPRILPDHLAAEIDLAGWPLPPVFGWLQEGGQLPEDEMLITFNCGLGMVMIVAPDHAQTTITALEEAGETVYPIGKVTKRDTEPVHYINAFRS